MSRLPVTLPHNPLTPEDTVTRVALAYALRSQVYGNWERKKWVIAISRDSSLALPRALPRSDTLEFALLTPDEVQQFANEYGSFPYVSVGPTVVNGDSATVGIVLTGAIDRTEPPGMLSFISCQWHLGIRDDHWEVGPRPLCLIS
jgi:hypothetical protein